MPRSPIQDQLNRVRPVWEAFLPDWRQVALASRLRVARNLAGSAFPLKASAEELERVAEVLGRRVHGCSALRGGPRGRIDRLKPLERELLAERRLISPELARGGPGRSFAAGRTHHLVAMVNEDDHLRLHAILPGLALSRAWTMVSAALAQLGDGSDFAFDTRLGFLTSSPACLGTGMRASVMLHLPGLALRGEVGQVEQALTRLGATLRGAFGDGSEAWGDLYQLGNAVSLGENEEATVGRVDELAREVIRHEQSARLGLARRETIRLYDHIGRSYGILRFSRLLTTEEALGGISALVTGVRLGILPTVNLDALNRLLLDVQPGHLRCRAPAETERAVHDVVRADRVREALSEAPR